MSDTSNTNLVFRLPTQKRKADEISETVNRVKLNLPSPIAYPKKSDKIGFDTFRMYFVNNLKDQNIVNFNQGMVSFVSKIEYFKLLEEFDRYEFDTTALTYATLDKQFEHFLLVVLRNKPGRSPDHQTTMPVTSPGVIRSAYAVFAKFWKLTGRGDIKVSFNPHHPSRKKKS